MKFIDKNIETTWSNAFFHAGQAGMFIPSFEQAKKIKVDFEFWTCETPEDQTPLAKTNHGYRYKHEQVRTIFVSERCPTREGKTSYVWGDVHQVLTNEFQEGK